MPGMTDEEMFAAPAPGPVTTQPLPNLPGYVSDPTYTPPQGQGGNPTWQAPAIPLGGPGQGLTDDQLFGVGDAPLRPDAGLGFYAGAVKPIDRAAEGLEWLAGKVGIPTDKIDAAAAKVGLSSAAGATADHGAFVDRQALQGIRPGPGGEFLGSMAATLPMTAGLGPLAGGAATGALLGDSKSAGGLAMDAAKGAAFGKVSHALLGGLGAIVAPKVAPAIQTLLNENIPVTLGQIAGGTLRRVEDGLTSLPMVGDLIKNAQRRGVEGLNLAVANRALRPIGEAVPADVMPGREAIAHAGDLLSARYEALLPGLTVRADPAFGDAIRSLGDAANDMPSDMGRQLGRFAQQHVISKFDENGVMSGDALKTAESALSKKIGRYRVSQNPDHQEFADSLETLRDELRGLVARNNPQAASELQALNQGWANLAVGETAASRLGADEGLFSARQLAGAVRQANQTVRKRGYARGEALMQDLSDAAVSRMPSTVPDSGSPLRHLIEVGVGAGVGKEAGAGALVGKAGVLGTLLSLPYTKPGQALTQELLTGARPESMQAIGEIIQRLRLPAAHAASVSASLPAPHH